MIPTKLLRSLLALCLFILLIGNPEVWRIAGFSVPEFNYHLSFGFFFRLLCFILKIGIYQVILGGFVASIIWIIFRFVMYKDPSIDKMKSDVNAPIALKKWKNIPISIIPQYLIILIQCLLWAIVFVLALLIPILPEGFYNKGFVFGLIMVIVNMVPTYLKMWMEFTYPNKLLAIGFAKGAIGNLIIGFVLTYVIWKQPFGCELTFCNCLFGCNGDVPFFLKFLC